MFHSFIFYLYIQLIYIENKVLIQDFMVNVEAGTEFEMIETKEIPENILIAPNKTQWTDKSW